MRAITLHRPWDWAMAHGGKDIENRDWEPWPAVIGQRIALHSGKHYSYSGAEFIRGILGAQVTPMPETYEGTIGAVTTVLGWVRIEWHGDKPVLVEASRGLSDAQVNAALGSRWLMGPFGWVVENTVALPRRVSCKGKQGLWTLPRAVEAEVLAQLAA